VIIHRRWLLLAFAKFNVAFRSVSCHKKKGVMSLIWGRLSLEGRLMYLFYRSQMIWKFRLSYRVATPVALSCF